MVYLIHFDEPYHHARHYLGYVEGTGRRKTSCLVSRLKRHQAGNGSELLAALSRQGRTWRLTRVWWEGTRDLERQLKKAGHVGARNCPFCNQKVLGELVKTQSSKLKPWTLLASTSTAVALP